MANLDTTTSYEHFGKCDIVVEAVFEDINIKHKVVKEVEQVGFIFLFVLLFLCPQFQRSWAGTLLWACLCVALFF